MVDVSNKDRTSDSSAAYTDDAPRFGSRRLHSPEALKILENGKIRRQMLSSRGKESPDLTPIDCAATVDSDASTADTPSLSYSFDSSPDITSRPRRSVSNTFHAQVSASSARLSRVHPAVRGEEQARIEQLLANGPPTRAPPSTSQFTAPLQTIKSEAVLPIDADGFKDVFKDDNEEEVSRTLTQLEGKGSPPKLHVDQQTLQCMFGHLKRGQEHPGDRASGLNRNAAAAEKFLAKESQRTIEQDAIARKSAQHIVRQVAAPGHQHSDSTITHTGTAISKWSDSTPSDNPYPRPSEDVFGGRQLASQARVHPSRASRSSSKEMVSIGFPSTIAAKPEVPAPAEDDDADAGTVPSRRSSTTLGKRKPGSVRDARAGLLPATPSFARPTTATQYKRAAKVPVPKGTSPPESVERGRTVSAGKSQPETGRAKVESPKHKGSNSSHN